MSRAIPIDVRREAHRRVVAVLRCLAVLVPDATPRQRKRLANKFTGGDHSVRSNEMYNEFRLILLRRIGSVSCYL